ncbi:MAG: c-type cytochrome biogenesis protein CcmI, partial [Proteobacteria bacterium]|nr:c-type cytochrome biogenesis protein CcmI [Pseudomonadota bacterium]
MTVWIIAVFMCLAAIAAVLIPLIRSRGPGEDAAAYDIEVYKDQLDQVGYDYDRGLLTADQAQAAKTEISRRILLADRKRNNAKPAASHSLNRTLAVILAIAIPAVALGFYTQRGAPHLPGLPFAERAGERTQTAANGEAATSLEASAATLAKRLEKEPDDLQGWVLLARTYMSIGSYRESVAAFERALKLETGEPSLYSAYGEALFMAASSVVTPAGRTAFETALKLDPADSRARFYMALAEDQAGNRKQALDQWAALLADSPGDAPWVPAVRDRIRNTAEALGLDVATIMPEPQSPDSGPQSGPTKAEMAAAAQMSPEERQAMIDGMIDGLAQRLAEDPRDFAGWQRLIRAYSVQNRKDMALAALADARRHFAAAPFPMQQLAELAGELGLEAPQPAEAPPGPSAEQMADAQNMSPEDRQAMIEGMVAQLAEKLKENPGDIAGWTRLARSYAVLGQPEKARDALAGAVQAVPDNIDLLILYGRAIRGANGDRPTTDSVATMRRILVLSPDNI